MGWGGGVGGGPGRRAAPFLENKRGRWGGGGSREQRRVHQFLGWFDLAGDEGGVGGRRGGGRGLTRCGGLKNVWSGGWTWARKRGGPSLGTPGYA